MNSYKGQDKSILLCGECAEQLGVATGDRKMTLEFGGTCDRCKKDTFLHTFVLSIDKETDPAMIMRIIAIAGEQDEEATNEYLSLDYKPTAMLCERCAKRWNLDWRWHDDGIPHKGTCRRCGGTQEFLREMELDRRNPRSVEERFRMDLVIRQIYKENNERRREENNHDQ